MRGGKVTVGSGNFFSQLFFIWVFPFIILLRRSKDIQNIPLHLRTTETAEACTEVLEQKWKKEIAKAAKQNR